MPVVHAGWFDEGNGWELATMNVIIKIRRVLGRNTTQSRIGHELRLIIKWITNIAVDVVWVRRLGNRLVPTFGEPCKGNPSTPQHIANAGGGDRWDREWCSGIDRAVGQIARIMVVQQIEVS